MPSDKPGRLCYAPPSPQLDPWCSGPTCQPVTLEIAGSNPVGSATNAFPYAPSARPDGAFLFGSGRPAQTDAGIGADLWQYPAVNRRLFLVVPALLVIALVITAIGLQVGSAWTGLASADTPASSAIAPASPSRGAPPAGGDPGWRQAVGAARQPTPASGLAASPRPAAPVGAVPIVPVTNFRGTATSTTRSEVASVLAGTSSRYQALELVADEADAILATLGLGRPGTLRPPRRTADAPALAADLRSSGKRLAFVRADAVGPEVRALAWGQTALFGVGRVRSLADWPLNAAPTTGGRRRRVRSGDHLDPVRRWRHPARPRRLPDGQAAAQGRRLPVRRRLCRDHQPVLLFDLRLGAPADPADWRRGRGSGPHRGRRSGDRQLREPRARSTAVSHVRNDLLGRSRAHRRPGERGDRLRLAGQQPHPRRRRSRDPPDDREPGPERDRVIGFRQESGRRPAARAAQGERDDRRDPGLRRDRRRISRHGHPDRERAAHRELRSRGREGRSGRRAPTW